MDNYFWLVPWFESTTVTTYRPNTQSESDCCVLAILSVVALADFNYASGRAINQDEKLSLYGKLVDVWLILRTWNYSHFRFWVAVETNTVERLITDKL